MTEPNEQLDYGGEKLSGYAESSLRVLVANLTLCLILEGCNLPEPPQTAEAVPSEYANSHMPEGRWTDEVIIEEGRQLYLGIKKPDVNCAQCHGQTDKPVRSGARDFRNTSAMKEYSDSHLLWRISEGVPFSQMRGYRDKLSEEEVWKVIAFVSTLGLNGLHYDPKTKGWISSE